MRVFKTKWFARWANDEGVSESAALLNAVEQMRPGF